MGKLSLGLVTFKRSESSEPETGLLIANSMHIYDADGQHVDCVSDVDYLEGLDITDIVNDAIQHHQALLAAR